MAIWVMMVFLGGLYLVAMPVVGEVLREEQMGSAAWGQVEVKGVIFILPTMLAQPEVEVVVLALMEVILIVFIVQAVLLPGR